MLGKVERLEQGICAYECTKLPLPWNGPDAAIEEIFIFYVVGREVYISGPVARQMCHGKRTDAKCPVKGVVVEELHRTTKWYCASTDLEPTWKHYAKDNAECPSVAQFMETIFQAVGHVQQEAKQAFLDKIHHVRLQVKEAFPDRSDAAPYMIHLFSMERDPYEGALSDAKLQSLIAMLFPEPFPLPAADRPAITADSLLQELRPRIAELMRSEEEHFVKRMREEEEACKVRMQEFEEGSRKRMRDEEELMRKRGEQLTLNQIEKVDLLNKRLHGM